MKKNGVVKKLIRYACLMLLYQTANAQQHITVKVNEVKAAISPAMWGIFFEDINMAADGGLYAELVKNRSFEFNDPLMGWTELKKGDAKGTVLVENRSGAQASNPRYLKVNVNSGTGAYGLANEGFRGMGIKQGNGYNFSLWAAIPGGSVAIRAELVSPAGTVLGNATVQPSGKEWKKYTAHFTAGATEPRALLRVWFEGNGVVNTDMISLFPQDTWKQRPGGLRADLVQLLADLQPGFVRFPGGCIVEGRDLLNRYQWKQTVGNVEDRKVIINRWNTEFAHRPTPDYYQSYGLGFFEYFQLAEDIGASPLPILNCGMACQFNTGEVVSTSELDPYIQDALDLIEFANGDTTGNWGKLRAAMGHPAPFHLKMMGIGNEQWGPQYIERFTYFAKAIKSKYPQVQLVNSLGPDPEGPRFNFLNDTLRKMHADLLDEHYYRSPAWFLEHANRYDHYDRNGPHIFAGEYAAQSARVATADNKNTWGCALAEAAFMTGLERNADVVQMASYAPLLAHIDGWQWTPDLIWFDNLRSYGTTDYYVQQLFSRNKGTHTVPMLLDNGVMEGKDSLYGSACIDKNDHSLVLKLVNAGGVSRSGNIAVEGVKKLDKNGEVTLLYSSSLDAVNSFDALPVSPKTQSLAVKGNSLQLAMPAYSFTVVRVKYSE